jgi:hypothetical protein
MYYELNTEVPMQDVIEAGETLMESGMWPSEEMELLRWETTVDG